MAGKATQGKHLGVRGSGEVDDRTFLLPGQEDHSTSAGSPDGTSCSLARLGSGTARSTDCESDAEDIWVAY